ncbi:MAG: ABC transporter ATP-binding protein [Chloroflexi bacterium]|nr:ABC transporter ATP-binding protein [Chloroflexota bacterium]
MSQEIDVSLVHVTKKFGDLIAVNDVSFDVPKGSFFSILGPSGSGKTTVLRMIAGFETPTAGEIFIGGERVNDVPPNKRRCNMVFQRLALFPMMDVLGNVTFGLRRRGGMSKAEMEKLAHDALERVGLKGLEKRKINQISGGQQQRVALARSLVLDPTVLLLDEPLGSLDLKLRQDMKLELKHLQARMGTTFVYITHDQTIALAMSDTIAVINAGKIEQIAAPEELYRRPATHFVASFVGENNQLMGGRVTRLVDDHACEVDVGGLAMVGRMGERMVPGDKVDLFIRPEMILLQPGKRETGILGKVEEINFDGSHSLIIVDLLESATPLSINVKLQHTEQAPEIALGDIVTLSWRWDAANAFPPAEQSLSKKEV